MQPPPLAEDTEMVMDPALDPPPSDAPLPPPSDPQAAHSSAAGPLAPSVSQATGDWRAAAEWASGGGALPRAQLEAWWGTLPPSAQEAIRRAHRRDTMKEETRTPKTLSLIHI